MTDEDTARDLIAFAQRPAGRQPRWFVIVAVLIGPACGVFPEGVSHDDPRLKPMLEAMDRVDRRAMGFTPIARDASIRLEQVGRWRRNRNYDVMLHIRGKTSRTVAFTRTESGYEWIGEQETFTGPREYETVDGRFQETITINYERVPISGFPLNRVAAIYGGEEPALVDPLFLSLETVRPWLKKWGYD